jgi:transposase
MRPALEKNGEQQLGRSRGGFGTKIHAVCDALGNPVKFLLTPGQTHDMTQAQPLLKDLTTDHVIADKGYDGDQTIAAIEESGAEAVIPPKSNRKVQRIYDKHLYKERNHIERLFARLKQGRRIATRYDKTARNFLAFLHLAASMILLA